MDTISWSGKLEHVMRLLVPHCLTFAFFCLNLGALTVPYAGDLRPDFVLMAVFYWAIYRPTLMPPAATFAVGLGMDLLSGAPAGFFALTYTLIHWVVRGQRRFLMGQPYSAVWIGFAIVSLSAGLLQWTVFGLLNLHLVPAVSVLFKTGLEIFLFPLAVFLLVLCHKVLPGDAHP